jgi:hypothetical protein
MMYGACRVNSFIIRLLSACFHVPRLPCACSPPLSTRMHDASPCASSGDSVKVPQRPASISSKILISIALDTCFCCSTHVQGFQEAVVRINQPSKTMNAKPTTPASANHTTPALSLKQVCASQPIITGMRLLRPACCERVAQPGGMPLF